MSNFIAEALKAAQVQDLNKSDKVIFLQGTPEYDAHTAKLTSENTINLRTESKSLTKFIMGNCTGVKSQGKTKNPDKKGLFYDKYEIRGVLDDGTNEAVMSWTILPEGSTAPKIGDMLRFAVVHVPAGKTALQPTYTDGVLTGFTYVYATNDCTVPSRSNNLQETSTDMVIAHVISVSVTLKSEVAAPSM